MYGYYNVSFGFYTTRDVSYVYILLPTVAKLRHMEIFGEKICNIILNGVINMWLLIRCDQETSQLILLVLRLLCMHTHTHTHRERERVEQTAEKLIGGVYYLIMNKNRRNRRNTRRTRLTSQGSFFLRS